MTIDSSHPRHRRQRGAAVVEFALLLPLLVLLSMGVIDVGDAWFRSATATSATRAGAITAFDIGNDRSHDLRVLQTLVTEFDNRSIENITQIILFDATGTTTVPSACLTAAARVDQGVTGLCVVYDQAFLNQIRSAAGAGAFIDGDCPNSRDHRWCTEIRTNAGGWWVGIYVEANQNVLTGVVPMFQDFTISETVIVKEWPRD